MGMSVVYWTSIMKIFGFLLCSFIAFGLGASASVESPDGHGHSLPPPEDWYKLTNDVTNRQSGCDEQPECPQDLFVVLDNAYANYTNNAGRYTKQTEKVNDVCYWKNKYRGVWYVSGWWIFGSHDEKGQAKGYMATYVGTDKCGTLPTDADMNWLIWTVDSKWEWGGDDITVNNLNFYIADRCDSKILLLEELTEKVTKLENKTASLEATTTSQSATMTANKDELKQEISGLKSDIDGDISDIRSDLNGKLDTADYTPPSSGGSDSTGQLTASDSRKLNEFLENLPFICFTKSTLSSTNVNQDDFTNQACNNDQVAFKYAVEKYTGQAN